MRLLIIDAGGHALDLAIRAKEDGHEVKLFIKGTDRLAHIGVGFVERVEAFEPWLRWANLIFLSDNTLYLRQLDQFRKAFPDARIVGPTEAIAEWELNRLAGMKVLEKHGIEVPTSTEFNDYDKAIAHVKKENRRFVSKASGDVPDKALSYCAKSPVDMVYMLERWKKLGKHKTPFILQEFVSGVEMAVGGWFGPGGFNEGWCENFEFKKLMNDDMGVATGEQGTVLRYVRQSKLARKMLRPLEAELDKLGYCGYIDVNCIIDDKGQAWPLEFTMRPGWPTFQIEQPLHEGGIEWLMDLAEGRDAREKVFNLISTGVVMSIPDYPYSHSTKKEIVGVPIYGIKPSIWRHIHPCEMMMGDCPAEEGGKIVSKHHPMTAGDYVLVMTAMAETVKDSALTAYRRLERLTVPNSPMYRTDIGKRLAKQLPKIQGLGYATEMIYSPAT
jgi:phosphoribosylamine--glycine ligase